MTSEDRSVDSSDAGMVEGWVLSFAFESWEVAGTVYEQARDLVFSEDTDASAYRILLGGRPYVVVLGFGPTRPELQREAELLLGSFGEDSQLPEEVLLALALGHGQFRSMKYERRGFEPPTVTFE